MSNNLTVITGQLPDHLRQIGYQDSGLGAGITPRAPKLSVTLDKRWAVTKDGNTMFLPTPTVRAVLVASAENITKAWYSKPYTPGSNEAPDCYSDDGRVPAPGVKAPQCSNCAACPKNAFGSHPVTGRGKACGDRKRVVLVWEGAPDELMVFNVPTMSMQALRKIDTELRNANIPPQGVMMELRYDPAHQYPVVQIGAVGFIDQQTTMNLIARSKSQEVAELLRETEFDAEGAQAAPEPAPVVPNQVIQFGQGVQGEANPPVNTQVEVPEKPKRTRRTKAEMEAARAAEAAAKAPQATQEAQSAATFMQGQTTVQQPVEQVQQAQQAMPGAQVGGDAAPAGGLDVASLLSKWQ